MIVTVQSDSSCAACLKGGLGGGRGEARGGRN